MERPKDPVPLVEGVDYYMEGPRLVFTAAYHKKRGFCCNSKCRHCPYGANGALKAGGAGEGPSVITIEGVPRKRSL